MMGMGEQLAKVLHYYGIVDNPCKTKYKCICPFHPDINESLSVDFEKGLWYCFGCQLGGKPQDFVQHMFKVYGKKDINDLQAALKVIKIAKSKKCANIRIQYGSKKKKQDESDILDMAHSYYYGLSRTDWENLQDPDMIEVRDYMAKRGFDAKTLKKGMARYNYNCNYSLIFPIMDNGEFRGWVCRTHLKHVEQRRKYLYNTGFSRSTTLAGNYQDAKALIVVEGYMDMLRFMQYGFSKNVVAILGWKMSDAQIDKIKALKLDYIVSALDNDECGDKGTEYLKKVFGKDKVVRWHYLDGVKDVGEADRDTFDIMYYKTGADIRAMEDKKMGKESVINLIKQDSANAGKSRSKILYVKEGEKKRIRFLHDMDKGMYITMHDSYKLNVNVPCQKTFGRPCPYCEQEGLRTRNQYAWCVYDYDDNEVKIAMYANNQCTPVNTFLGFYEAYGTLLDRDYTLSVSGSGKGKTYSVVPQDKNSFKLKDAKVYPEKTMLKLIDEAFPTLESDGTERDDTTGMEWDEDKSDKLPDNDTLLGYTPVQLYNLCKERDINVKAKQDKLYYIEHLNTWREFNEDDDINAAAETDNTGVADDEWPDDNKADAVDYDTLKPVELYKLCVERDIAAETKKNKAYYIRLLKEYDKSHGEWQEDDKNDDTDGWSDEEMALPFN